MSVNFFLCNEKTPPGMGDYLVSDESGTVNEGRYNPNSGIVPTWRSNSFLPEEAGLEIHPVYWAYMPKAPNSD